jgi:oxygen-independent coproporphyrinogen-3 oxidase
MNITVEKSQHYMSRSFRRTMYKWIEKPGLNFRPGYGMYVNIPFCRSFCSFCPFYKVKADPDLISQYIGALVDETERINLPGSPGWIYFGGGTPNVLTLGQLGRIINKIEEKTGFREAGIELLPEILTEDYLRGLVDLGFKKVSLGVESLDSKVSRAAGRLSPELGKLLRLIEDALSKGLFVNIDLMVGLQGQSPHSFLDDLEALLRSMPSQFTIYPYMLVRGFNKPAGFSTNEQFSLIEKAYIRLKDRGYGRISPWTFSRQNGEYDCSKAELVNDYVGLGAGSFSTDRNWKVVNPPVAYYVDNQNSSHFKALVAGKEPLSDQWRMFGKMLSDLSINNNKELSPFINTYILWLRIAGFITSGKLTEKGMFLAHNLMKTIVESLPFPLLDHRQIDNPDEFIFDTNQALSCKRESAAISA